MNRRTFLAGTGLVLTNTPLRADAPMRRIDIDGVRFRTWHENGRLSCVLTAPTEGWLAVGFNNDRRLEGTRFVIGSVDGGRMRVEEHIATVPTHAPVQAHGLSAAVQAATVEVRSAVGRLAFSWPHQFADTDNPTLGPGQSTYLMLAWSHHVDFGHHSAWRRHFDFRL